MCAQSIANPPQVASRRPARSIHALMAEAGHTFVANAAIPDDQE